MATGNVDYSLSEEMYNFTQPLNLNIFNTPGILDCDSEQTCLNLQPTIPSNITRTPFDETQGIESLTTQLLNEHVQHPILDRNENNIDTNPVQSSLDIAPLTCPGIMDNNKNSFPLGDFAKCESCPSLQIQKVMPEELFINVESDDEGVHSWRPNMSSDSLCSDFFMTPALFQDGVDLPISSQNQNYEGLAPSQIGEWTPELQTQPLVLKQEHSGVQPFRSPQCNQRLDLKSYLQSQMVGFNTAMYELMKARRKVKELKEEIKSLSHSLQAKLTIQKALGVEKLKEENAQLRLECQCLCMEVDYYLKGKAPLGEVDENFYQGKSQSAQKKASQDQPQIPPRPTHHQCPDIDEQEEHKKWECHKCTFANHPAINSCEMCHTPRLSTEHTLYATPSSSVCYCHPKEDSS